MDVCPAVDGLARARVLVQAGPGKSLRSKLSAERKAREALDLYIGASVKSDAERLFEEQEEIDAERRALRVLLDSFHVETEIELAKVLEDEYIQRRIGKFIAERAVRDRRKH